MLQQMAFFSVLDLHFALWARFPSDTTYFCESFCSGAALMHHMVALQKKLTN